MKTNNFFIILLLFVFYGCAKDKAEIIKENREFGLTLYNGAGFPEVSDKYVYPIVPGMEEWKIDYDIETTDPWQKFCQLPDSVLKTISTPGLIDALIFAPMFTALSSGLSSVPSLPTWNNQYRALNSAKELFQREDAGNALVAYYEFVCLDCIKSSRKELERLIGLEFLFTKQQILDKIGQENKKRAVTTLLANYKKSPDYDRILPMVYIMYADGYTPMMEYAKDNNDILNGYYGELTDLIVTYAKNYVNEK